MQGHVKQLKQANYDYQILNQPKLTSYTVNFVHQPCPPNLFIAALNCFEIFRIGEERCHQLLKEILGVLDSRLHILKPGFQFYRFEDERAIA